MTGFGRGSATGEDFTVAVELKTVNNRYLDIHFRLSQELAPLEMTIRKLVGSRLSRGTSSPTLDPWARAWRTRPGPIAAFDDASSGANTGSGVSTVRG